MDTAFTAALRTIALATARAERARAYARAVGALDTAQSAGATIPEHRELSGNESELPAAEAAKETQVPR